MFEDATFHSRGILPGNAPKWIFLTSAINATALTALIVLPLLNPQSLPSQLQPILYAPPIEPAPVLHQAISQPASTSSQAMANPHTMLVRIPTITPIDPGPVPTATIVDLSAAMGNGIGAASSATAIFPSTQRPAVKPALPGPVVISRGVFEGLLIAHANPSYPALARGLHISGTVVLAATIASTGVIENLRVLSGHPMLRQSAIDAVKTWRYRPYLLNNQPVAVETTINIVFSLSANQ